ncbi:hypothetical protein HQ531_04485 [bacterium]|nr:hypothetical protein [bacterium]
MKHLDVSITISIDRVQLNIPDNSIPDTEAIKSIEPELISLIQARLNNLIKRIQNEKK